MTITTDDVKLLKSQRLTDEDDGGGRATGNAVADGELNNLFPDISRLDRTLGRISLRKVFAGVITDNSDPYLGVHAIVTESPADPRVSIVLFNSGSQTDERLAAQTAIENYVVPSTTATWELIGDQLAGQRALLAVQREEEQVPEVGDVYQLLTDSVMQYVRLTSVEHEIATFVYDYGNGNFTTFTRRRLNLGISTTLLYRFPGGQVYPAGTTATGLNGQPKARVYATQVADAARYYGISPLAVACAAGDLTLTVQSVYAHLVPSTTKETALVDQPGGPLKRFIVASGPARTLSLTFASAGSGQSRAFLTTGAARGSVTLTISSGVYQDTGNGEFKHVSGSNSFTRISVDYETGEINAYRSSAFTGAAQVTYTPAAASTGQAVTGEIPITLGSRGYAYTLNMADAKPLPGTLVVSYMALGKWYELADKGNGELAGEGSGTVNYATGAVSLSLNALPDVDSALIYHYVTQADGQMTPRTGSVDARAKVRHRLPHDGILPGSLTVTYTVGGTARTLSDAGNGTLSGAGAGVITYATGEVAMELAQTPDSGTEIVYAYQQGEATLTVLSPAVDGAGMVTGTIPGAPLKPGSLQMAWGVARRSQIPASGGSTYESSQTERRSVQDNGAGGWIGRTGSIDYQTGVFTLVVEQDYTYTQYQYKVDDRQHDLFTRYVYRGTGTTEREQFGGTLEVKAQAAAETYGQQTARQAAPAVTLDLLPSVSEPIVPGSLILTWGGQTYVDRDGILFRGISTSTNAGTAVGTVDYAAGEATLTSYPAGAAPTVTIAACLTSRGGFTTSTANWRTPGAPLRPASLQITAVRADTAQVIVGTADLNGAITGGGIIHGTVDIATGIVRVRFTTNPADATGSSDVPVIASLLRYNAVLQTSLPLNAELLGLDPVRLPADGRVPIYREGEVVVVHHVGETLVASPAAGGTVQLARALQAAIEVVDASGTPMPLEDYTVDRQRGRVTWANPLPLLDASGNALTLPLTIRDRVEHMAVVTEVQITGAVSLSAPMPWALPAGEAMLSSAVTWGDLQARLYRWYTQKTWNTGAPNWSSAPIGDSTTSNYNQLNYPPVVTNRGAISAKWALVFTSSTSFQVVEEKLGVITTGSTASDCAPINPATGAPYFTIRAAGWGSGWAAGNAVRFDTDACLGPLWIARTVLSGQGTVEDDQFRIQIRGDAD